MSIDLSPLDDCHVSVATLKSILTEIVTILKKQVFYKAATGTPQTLNTSAMTTLTGLSQSVTVEDGQVVIIKAQLNNSMSNLSANCQFQIYRDSTALSSLARNECKKADGSNAGLFDVVSLSAHDLPGAGTYTYTVKGRLGSGSSGNGYLGASHMIIEVSTNAGST